ncbi:hypothetical protein [Aquimarina sp. 2201CG14-23]|uniref:hypothetical protein n=1 Tax=Aquimarina mycalae TaxID=3040073 RepID=UPI002477D67F|nr:hypothetical protein [Aquimarina sp. 2201CG14-23]MDH7444940.1 hypothetical protein [Aquimarina sp. 2201CG14-23]
MNKTLLLLLTIVFGCNSQTIEIAGKEEIRLEQKEFEEILQAAIDINHIDYFFDEKEKNDGLTIVINEFIEPYYKNLSLRKFDKKVYFKNHKAIFIDKDKKFVDILKPFKKNDTIHITYGIRSRRFAVIVKFIRSGKNWVSITPNISSKSKAIYHFKMDKEQCLAEQINDTKYGKSNKCVKYDFLIH